LSGTSIDMPGIARITAGSDIDATLVAAHLDIAAGVFSGLALLPTVGGFASLDLLGSVGAVALPDDQGFVDGWTTSWALGARLGILRESFTAPGISLSGTYRRVGEIAFGDSDLTAADSYFRTDGFRLLSGRAVVGKRFFVLGTSAGIGYDHFQTDLIVSVRNPAGAPAGFDIAAEDFSTDRLSFFGSLNYTVLVLALVAEAGWQTGGDAFVAALPGGRTSGTRSGAFFGSLAARLTL
jgi:hypothetical protein